MRRSLLYISTQTAGFYDLPFDCCSFCKKPAKSLQNASKSRVFALKKMLFHSINIPKWWRHMFSTLLIIVAMFILLNEKKGFFRVVQLNTF